MFAHIFKKWSREAWQASAEARRHAHMKNAAVAESLHTLYHQNKDMPNIHEILNAHMIKNGYMPTPMQNGVRIYMPHSGDTNTETTPTNPVIGHKVHIVLDTNNGSVDAVSRYH